MTEAEFDRYLRAVKPRDRILNLCERVDEIQKEAGVREEVMKGARRRTKDEVMTDVRLLEELRRG
jgi:hypothetical protein